MQKNMDIYIYTHVYIYIYIYIHMCVYIFTHVCILYILTFMKQCPRDKAVIIFSIG